MKVHDAVAAKLGMQGVVIHAWRMHVLAEEGIGVVFTDGLVDVFLHVGVNMERDADIDVGETVAHMTGVSGVTEAWCGNGMLRMGVIECVGGRPFESVVFNGSSRWNGVDGGRLAITKVSLVGRGHGHQPRAIQADNDLCRAGAATLRVGDGDGESLRFLKC